MANGTAELDFLDGGMRYAHTTVAVSGQGGIVSTSPIQVWMQGDSTADNGPDAHILAACLVSLVAGSVTAGVGFTIHGICAGELTKKFKVRWRWE